MKRKNYKILSILVVIVIILATCYYSFIGKESSQNNINHVNEIDTIITTHTTAFPILDGINSTGEWNEASFYHLKWTKEYQNISPYDFDIQIGFMYNSTYLFIIAILNDDDFALFDNLLLLFDSNNDVSNFELDHVSFFAGNGTYNLDNDGHGYLVNIDGKIEFCRCGIHWYSNQPVNVTFNNPGGYVFEGMIKLDRLAVDSDYLRLNILYKDMNQNEIVYLIDPLLTEDYPRFIFE